MIGIRQASVADIPVIRAIAQATWPVAYKGMISPEQIAYMLELMYGEGSLREQMGTKGHRFLIAEVNGTPIGFAGFEHHHEGRTCTRLHKLYVLPGHQGSGAGRSLLKAVLEATLAAGDLSLDLTVNRRNQAIAFYRAQGFTIERDVVMDIGQGYVMDDHVMVLDI